MRLITWLGLSLALAITAGCSVREPPSMPKDAEAAAIKTFDQVAAGDIAGLQARGDPGNPGSAGGSGDPPAGQPVARLRPTASRSLRWTIFKPFGGGERASIIREYSYPDHVVLTDTTLTRQASGLPWKVQGFNLRIATRAELAANRFTLQGRSPVHYLVLAGAILSPLICLFGFVTVLRAPKFKWKWAFALLSLLAFVQFGINWATGAFSFSPISF